MKTKIVIVLILIASIAMFSTGAFAYFTSTRDAGGQIKSGNLELKVAMVASGAACPAQGSDQTLALWNLEGLAPADVVSGRICMYNTGSLPIKEVLFNWTINGGSKLAEHLFITSIKNSQTNPSEEIGSYIAQYGGGTGHVTLAQLAGVNYSSPLGVLDEYWAGAIAVFLPAGGTGSTQWVDYTFEFDKDADGPELMGVAMPYTLTLKGTQIKQLP